MIYYNKQNNTKNIKKDVKKCKIIIIIIINLELLKYLI